MLISPSCGDVKTNFKMKQRKCFRKEAKGLKQRSTERGRYRKETEISAENKQRVWCRKEAKRLIQKRNKKNKNNCKLS